MQVPGILASMKPFGPLLLSFLTILAVSGCAPVKEAPVVDGSQTGIASWYGKDFHGKPTASGEIYDMYAMTAAHKTLALGTILEVVNLDNGARTKVVVNDRGPFVAGRIIDLSYSAAKELEMVGPGTARVAIRVTGRDGRYVRRVAVSDSGRGVFVVQLGAFVEMENAERLKTAVGWKRSGVFIARAEVNGRTFYRVRLGGFKSREAAMGLASELAEEGYQAVLMRE